MGWDIVADKFLDFIKIIFSRKNPSEAMVDAINVRLLGEELVESHLSVDCFFIVMVHNHGGRIRPDNFIFWSVIDGFYNDIMMKKFFYKNYQMVHAETELLQLARQVYEKKEFSVRVSEMVKSSLRTSFEYQGLKYIRFYYLKQNKRAMWFIMVGTTAEKESLDSIEHEGKIFIAVNGVKNIIRGY
jgi:hypothetical protein